MKKKYYDIHVAIVANEGFSVFVAVDNVPDLNDADVIGSAVDQGLLEPDYMTDVDNVSEIDITEYEKGIAA